MQAEVDKSEIDGIVASIGLIVGIKWKRLFIVDSSLSLYELMPVSYYN